LTNLVGTVLYVSMQRSAFQPTYAETAKRLR